MTVVLVLLLLGLVLGSFINAFVWRLHNGKDWVKGRSECTHCHHELAAKDLIPVVSYIALKGKCRYCHKPIDDTPIVELALPLLFIASYIFWPFALSGSGLVQFVFWIVFLIGFVALADYDIRWLLLPDKIVFPFVLLAILETLILQIYYHGSLNIYLTALYGVLVVSGLFYVLFQVSKGKWIGGGDVKLGLLLGIVIGGPLQSILLLFLSSLLGTIFTLPSLIRGKTKVKTLIPFGPFLLLAAVIVKLFGTPIVNWYTSFLH